MSTTDDQTSDGLSDWQSCNVLMERWLQVIIRYFLTVYCTMNNLILESLCSLNHTAGRQDMWDQRYSERGYAYGTCPNDFLVEAAAFLQPQAKILCLAEGEGRNAVYLATEGHHVVAVDTSAVGLAKAAKLALERGVVIETIIADLSSYLIEPLSFDAIISIFCHLPPPAQARIHAQIYQGLRPGGGIFILEGYSKNQQHYTSGGPKNSALLMNLKTIKAELSPLVLKHAVEIERHIHEGAYHNGRGSVVQIIAEKM
jgi:SAM-dependent methyltransferase